MKQEDEKARQEEQERINAQKREEEKAVLAGYEEKERQRQQMIAEQKQSYIQQQAELYKTELEEGTVPQRWKKWNWGIFFFPWLWGLFYVDNVKKILLIVVFILFKILDTFLTDGISFGIAGLWMDIVLMLVYLGYLAFMGNRWAFQNGCWQREEQYWKAQKKWTIVGAVFFVVLTVLPWVAFFLY